MGQTEKMPSVSRQITAVLICSVAVSLSTTVAFAVFGIMEMGVPDLEKLLRDSALIIMFVAPIAAVGIILFGLPLLFVIRRLGWITTNRQFTLLGLATGAMWSLIVSLIVSFRAEVMWFVMLVGSLNGLIVALLWLGIVHNFKLPQNNTAI